MVTLTFSYTRDDDEAPRAMLAMNEILNGERETGLSRSATEIFPFILDEIGERVPELLGFLGEDRDDLEGCVEKLRWIADKLQKALDGDDDVPPQEAPMT